MESISLALYTNGFFGSVLKSPIQRGPLSMNNSVKNISRLGTFKQKIWINFQRIIEFFTPKVVIKLSKICIWDPGSGKNLSRIPDQWVKKASDPGSGSATLLKR
jgi:hypothetical protein